jgi:hypothetical protein
VGVAEAVVVGVSAVAVVASTSQFKEWLCLRMQVSSRSGCVSECKSVRGVDVLANASQHEECDNTVD